MCIDHEKADFAKVEKLIKQKVTIIDEKDYLKQVVSKSRILGYKNFEENGKEKYNDIRRKGTKSGKAGSGEKRYGKE